MSALLHPDAIHEGDREDGRMGAGPIRLALSCLPCRLARWDHQRQRQHMGPPTEERRDEENLVVHFSDLQEEKNMSPEGVSPWAHAALCSSDQQPAPPDVSTISHILFFAGVTVKH